MSSNTNVVDLFLTEAKTLEGRRQELIRSLLSQRDAAIREYDAQLAKLGHKGEAQKRSHHRRAVSEIPTPGKPQDGSAVSKK